MTAREEPREEFETDLPLSIIFDGRAGPTNVHSDGSTAISVFYPVDRPEVVEVTDIDPPVMPKPFEH